VGLRRWLCFVHRFSVFLGGCNGGILGPSMILRGMDVWIVWLIRFVIVVYDSWGFEGGTDFRR